MSFEYRREPLKSLYLLYIGLSTVLVRLPYWFFGSLSPSWRPRASWGMGKNVVIHGLRTLVYASFKTGLAGVEDPEVAAASAQTTGFVWVEPTPDLVVGEVQKYAELNGIEAERTSGYWYGERDAAGGVGQQANADEKVIYQLHGGGYVAGSASPKDMMAPVICKGLLKHSPGIARIFCIEYRLSSAEPFVAKNPFPAALFDALAGYHYLISKVGFKAENIIISGDSAGGNLALTLTRYLVQNKIPAVPPPAGLLLLSPTGEWIVTQDTGPESSFQRNARSDYCQPFLQGYPAKALLGKMPANDIFTNPWISPVSLRIPNPKGIFLDFPKTCILVGEAEFQLDSMLTLRERFVQDIGVHQVTYIETFGATHDFLALSFHEPERTEGLKEVGKWIASF